MAAMEREILIETVMLERYTSIVGVIGNVAVYIGLFGTVLGIVNAFHNIASEATGGLGAVMAGVAEALICTATGLLVAVPAVVVYNYFVRRVDGFVVDMEYCSSELNDLMIAEDQAKCSSNG
jgi:biopolymer transport protein ExbB/TolQ